LIKLHSFWTVPGQNLGEVEALRLVFIDGVISESLSSLDGLPDMSFIGSIQSILEGKVGSAVSQSLELLGMVASGTHDDTFMSLNGIGAPDVGVVFVPEGVHLEKPVHIIYYSSGRQGFQGVDENLSSVSLSSPRLLVVAGKDAQLEIIEEFLGESGSACWTNSVCEISLSQGAQVMHSYVQEQERNSIHIKQTHVSQEGSSTYKLVEASVGGRLSRHNLQIMQLGPDTHTEFSTFQLAGKRQLQDLHSSLVLSYPRGVSRQLHKCIVTDSTGHAVFDGNVRVNRYAQQTDAGQLSRSLLLAPRATVNVKPNLQIIADDVKCSHGAAISDLEEEQLFYFRARGIDAETARSALVFSFGAEVLQHLSYESLRKRVEALVKGSLAAEGLIDSSIPVGL
jgi:Fe-S cluster assembly protein SufD